jgi:hypothetical protein
MDDAGYIMMHRVIGGLHDGKFKSSGKWVVMDDGDYLAFLRFLVELRSSRSPAHPPCPPLFPVDEVKAEIASLELRMSCPKPPRQ